MVRFSIFSALLLGFTAIIAQIIVLRESLAVFAGNELVLGIVLGNWLLLTGAGAWLGRLCLKAKSPLTWIAAAQLVMAVLPGAQILALRFYRGSILPGLMLGLGEAWGLSFAVLLPFCLISGFLLAFLSVLVLRDARGGKAASIYVFDTIGGIAGGLVFSYLLVFVFSPLETAVFLAAANLAAFSLLHGLRSGHKKLAWTLALGAAAVFAAFYGRIAGIEKWSLASIFAGQEILRQRSTPYSDLVITRQQGQLNVFADGQPLSSSKDPIKAEESVHYVLSQHAAPERALLLGGGLSGAIEEALKYEELSLEYVEIDPVLLELTRNLRGLEGEARVTMHADDARNYLRGKNAVYDAVIMSMPDPLSAQLGRFYSLEFFELAKGALRPQGVFGFSLSGPENYASPALSFLASSVYNTLSQVFRNVLVIPGGRQFFIASDGALTYQVAGLLEKKGIQTAYINAEYLEAKLSPERRALAAQAVSAAAPLSRDFAPVAYYATLKHWLSYFGAGLGLPLAFLALVLGMGGLCVWRSPAPPIIGAVAASGFAGMGLGVILLVAFQVLYGSLYQQLGIIITAFLIGAAAGGALFARKKECSRQDVLYLDALLCAMALILPVLISVFSTVENHSVRGSLALIFPLLNAGLGLIVGAQFAAAAALPQVTAGGKAVGQLYAGDFLGACLGAVVVSAFCIPLFGLYESCILIGALKMASSLWLRYGKEVQPEKGQGADKESSAIFSLVLVFFVFLGLGAAIIGEQGNEVLKRVAMAPAYHWGLAMLLGLGIAGAMGFSLSAALSRVPFIGAVGRGVQQLETSLQRRSGFGLWRWLNYLAFSLAVFYPLFRCFFKVPYLFCHVCPRKCVFGQLRPYLVPAALIMNLESRHWCYRSCPIGMLHDGQACRAATKREISGPWRLWPLAAIAFSAVAYFKVLPAAADGAASWRSFFYSGHFAVNPWALGLAGMLVLVAWRYRRAFCMLLCPVGNLSELILKAERRLFPLPVEPAAKNDTAEAQKGRKVT